MRMSAVLMECMTTMVSGYSRPISLPVSALPSLSRGEIFKVFVHTGTLKDEILIPVIARGRVEESQHSNGFRFFDEGHPVTFSMNLVANPVPLRVKTASTVWRQARSTIGRVHLIRIKSLRGEQYYAGNGFVLDHDFKPLMVSVLRARRKEADKIEYVGSMLYIHPDVMGSTGFLEKNIRNMVIPYLSVKRVWIPVMYNNSASAPSNSFVADIAITRSIMDFVSIPGKPNLSTFSDPSINQFLIDNIGDVIQIYES